MTPPSPPPVGAAAAAAAADQSHVHGVVIITLEPPDQPSKGKIVTAFTYSDDTGGPPVRQELRLFSRRRAGATVLALAALLVAGYYCLYYSDVAVQFLGEEEGWWGARRNDTTSFLLPLYPKVHVGRALQESGGVKMEVNMAAGAAAENSTAVLPVWGNVFPDGQYYTSILVGNPPRHYFLDVDTGSDLSWIQCDVPCRNCAKGPHPLYKPAKGNIVPPRDPLCQELQGSQNYCDTCNQCDYEITYADQSSSMGVLSRDDVHLITKNGEREKLDFVFGCAYDQQGQLLASPAKTDGTLGLSSAAISLPTQLASRGIISNVFGHCLSRDPNGGGFMFLGDEYVPRWGMTWVPIRSGPDNLYNTEVRKLGYGDQLLGVQGQARKLKVVFDSGSTYTYLPDVFYTELIAYLKDASPNFVHDDSDQTLPFCLKADFPVGSLDDVKRFFKPLTLQFRKRWFVMPRTFTIPPEDYLIISDKGNVCLGILDGMEINQGSTIIVGDVSLRGKLVVYDNQQNQIGWVKSECIKPQKQRGFPLPLRTAQAAHVNVTQRSQGLAIPS